MKKSVAFLVSIPALVMVVALMVFGVGYLTYETDRQDPCIDFGLGLAAASFPLKAAEEGDLTVKGQPISDDQYQNARAIYAAAYREFMFIDYRKAAAIGIATAIQESTLTNISYGYPGSTSVGLFQQIEAWGSYEDRMNPSTSATMFFTGGQAGQGGLADVPNWQTLSLTAAAQAVQHSGFPDAYAQWEQEANAIVSRMSVFDGWTGWNPNDPIDPTLPAECLPTSPLEEMIKAAVSRDGDDYEWEHDGTRYDGAAFLSWAAEQAGFGIPDNITDLAQFEASPSGDVKAEFIPVPRGGKLDGWMKRGDIPLFSDSGGNKLSDVTSAGQYLGSSNLGKLSIATYNVLGTSHTPHTGPESGVNRIEKPIQVIGTQKFSVVGMQELQADQRRKLQAGLPGYGMFPDPPNYGGQGGAPPRIHSDNTIIWDTSQVTFISGDSLPMPYTHQGIDRNIPVVLLQDNKSGQRFYVTNTHDPAGPLDEHPRLRWLDAQQHAQDMDKLVEKGLPVFFTGDFNSGFAVRSKGNLTYQNERSNLTWCIMTSSGTMLNSYDAWKGRGTKPNGAVDPCPEATSRERGIGPVDHIYVSPEVDVSNYQVISGRSTTGSDHPVVYIEVGSENPTATGTELTIATYNPRVGDGFTARIQRAKELATELGWSVIGFQEVEREPFYNALKSTFNDNGWKVYPDNPESIYRNGLNARAIAYDATRFELISSDEILFERMKEDGDPQPAHAPVIQLRDKVTDQEFFVVNTHSSAFQRYALERKQAGDAYVQKIQELKATGLPVLFTGDFNSGYWMRDSINVTWQNDRNNLTYCQLTKDGLMQDAKDVKQGIAGRDGGYCPRKIGEGPNAVDHIYVTPDVDVTEFESVDRARTLSDHEALYAHINIPPADLAGGSEPNTYIGPDPDTGVISIMPVPVNRLVGVLRLSVSDGGAIPVDGEWTLPIPKGQYTLTARFGDPGPYVTTHTGLDFAAGEGVQVYAASAGEVVSAGDAGAYGNRIIIRMADGSETWYCHLSAFDVTSGEVAAGTPIGKVGHTGNTSGPTGNHLHFEVRTPAGVAIDPFEFLRTQGLDP